MNKYPDVQYKIIGRRKYRVTQAFLIATGIKGYMLRTKYLTLEKDGMLEIWTGFIWNGGSGLAVDTANTMTATCVHDALYKLIMLGLLPYKYRKHADWLLKDIMIDDYAASFRAKYFYHTVRITGGAHLVFNLVRRFLTGKQD